MKSYFHLKDNKNYVGDLCIKMNFFTFIKMLYEIKKKFPQNNTKHTKKKTHFIAQQGTLVLCFQPTTTFYHKNQIFTELEIFKKI